MMNQLLGAIVMVVLLATFFAATLDGPRPLSWPASRPVVVAAEPAD